MDISLTIGMPTRKQKQKKLKDVKKVAKKWLKQVETQRINNKMIEIEEMKNESLRYFAALKEVQSERKQENLVVEDKNKKRLKKNKLKQSQSISRKCWLPREKKVTDMNFHHTNGYPIYS